MNFVTVDGKKPQISLLVTDLDNTLYDWFSMWHASFSAMIDSICTNSEIPETVLLPEIRKVFQRRGTSEYSYLLNELPALRARHPGQDISAVYSDAIHRYRSERKRNLKLYPGVASSLRSIRRAGVPIVVYTESLAYYSAWRLRELGLDGIVDYLYSPPDHEFPDGITADSIRTQDPDSYSLKHTTHKHTPAGVLKPNARVLSQIISDAGASTAHTAYVGDSLMKDIAMAQDIQVLDVLAEYGSVQDRSGYDLLRKVSHWTQADVEREKEISRERDVTPTYRLQDRFSELLEIFEFRGLRGRD